MKIYKLDTKKWDTTRIMYMIIGFFVLSSVLLSIFVHHYFVYFTGFVGFMSMFFSLTGYCPMAIILNRLFKIEEKCSK